MGCCSKTVLVLFTVVLVVVAILCHIIALVTHYWLNSSSDVQTNFLNLGLWRACFDDYIHPHESDGGPKVYDGCHGLYSDYYRTIRDWLIPSWLVACRICAIISLILQLIGLLLVIFILLWILCKWILCDPEEEGCGRVILYATPIIWILAGMFLMITCMIFADNAFRLQCKDFWLGGDPNTNHLSYSWGFEVAACIFSFLSGIFLIWVVVLKGRSEI